MSHSVIIIDRFGEPYEYFPPHDDPPEGGRVASDAHENGTVQRLSEEYRIQGVFYEVTEKEAKKIRKKALDGKAPSTDIPPDLLASIKEIFG